MDQLDFLRKALADDVRISNRGMNEQRPLKIKFGPKGGQVEVRLGDTLVMGRMQAAVVMPPADRPSEGSVVVSVQYSRATCSGERRSGSQVAFLLERLIRGSKIIDPEALCILAGRRVWALKICLRIVSDCGNAVDACGLAALGVLTHFRKQEVAIEGRDVVIHKVEEREPVPLPLLHHPLLVSYAIIRLEKKSALRRNPKEKYKTAVLVDPDLLEEAAGVATLTVAANAAGDICLISKNGGEAVDLVSLNMCLETATRHVREMSHALTEAINESLKERAEARRNVGYRYRAPPLDVMV